MLRFLQVQKDKPLEILTAGAALKRGAFVYKDAADSKLKVLATGLGDELVDISKNYDSANSYSNPSDASFETIASGKQCIHVPTMVGERYATSEMTPGYSDVGDPLTVTTGKLVRASSAAAYQWVYGGAYTDGSGITTYIAEKVPAATAPATRTVTYNANGGTGTKTDARSPYYVGKIATVLSNTFTAPIGKLFSKWNTAANGTGTNYLPAAEITIADSNIVLYAQWVDNPDTNLVTYDANTGAGTMTDALSPYEDGDIVTVKANTFVAPSGKAFVKWNTAANGSGTDYDPADEIESADDITLYAIWGTAFAVTYDANTGAGTMTDPSSPYLENATVTVLANAFTPPADKQFSKWNTLANGTGTDQAPASTFTVTAAVTLYAIWIDA